MAVKQGESSKCSINTRKSCCTIESVVSIDARGQIVLPKEIRQKANIVAGDKLAIISWKKDGKLCCISLMKVENFAGMVRSVLEPVISDILEEK